MAIATFKRYEKKFRINGAQLAELIPYFLKFMNYDEYCKNGEKYTIYNIYYDMQNSDIIRDNDNASTYKEKIRLRSYETAGKPEDIAFLELKKKENGIGNKRRISIRFDEVDDMLYRAIAPEYDDYLSNQVAKEILYYISLHSVKPTVYLQYDRLAFFGKDDDEFRITIDSNIRTRRENFIFGPTDEDKIQLPEDTYIMEIKLLGSLPLELAHKLSNMEIFSSGYSKYGNEFKMRLLEKKLPYFITDENGNESQILEFKG